MRRRLWWMARLLVAAGLLALVARLVDAPAALALLGGASPQWLALAFGLLSAQIVLSALRWRLTADRLGHAFGAGQAIREYYLGVLANFALPGGVLGDAARAVRARHGAGLGVAVQAVVLERMAGQVALVLALIPGLLLWPGLAPWGLALAAALLVAAGGLVTGPGRRAGRIVARAWLSRGAWPAQAGLSAAILAANLGAFAACAAATGVPLPATAALVLIPLALAAMLIPVSVAGWGLREGAAALLWPLAGLSAEAGVAASIAFGLVALAAVLPGLALMLSGRHAPAA
ncbi:MAG: flippase-like domain-containing protein [Rhodobacteraceae bacterium]|nr:flippase-like domain-containing protein [Paracoccaceae bacterium]